MDQILEQASSDADDAIDTDEEQKRKQFGEVVGFTNNVPFDELLPSFEMYNYIFNRPVTGQGDDDRDRRMHDPPYNVPKNNEVNNSSTTNSNTGEMLNATFDPNMAVLNNLEKIKTIDDSPVEITIELTKSLPVLGEPVEIETIHKEYKPGDIIAGYILIKNKTQIPIPFEMFIVSLEGLLTVKSFSKLENNSDINSLRKMFLRMFDFTACYHIGSIEVYPTGTIMCDTIDKIDGTRYGFNIDKILFPNETRKKFFLFKLPEYLLDNDCDYSFPEHLNLLPSFGSITTINNSSSSSSKFKFDEKTGIGKLNNTRGSPIFIRDNALPGQSISYSINVRCLAKKSTLDDLNLIKNLNLIESKYDLILFEPTNYFFRVKNNENKLPFSSNVSTQDQIKAIETLSLRTLDELLIKKSQLEVINYSIDSEIFEKDLNNQIQQLRIIKKQEQLSHSRRITRRKDSIVKRVSDSTTTNLENITVYVVEEIEKKSFFNSNKIGNPFITINITTSDTNSIQSRSVLQQQEKQDLINTISPQISSNTQFTDPPSFLQSISSSSITTVTNNDKKSSQKLKTRIQYKPTTNSSTNKSIKLPSNIIIKSTLKQLTLQSVNPIPFSIDSEFFLTTSTTKMIHEKLAFLKLNFNSLLNNISKLIELNNENNELIKLVPKPLINNLKSIKNLSFFESKIPNFFNEEKFQLSDKEINSNTHSNTNTPENKDSNESFVWKYDKVNKCYYVDLEFILKINEQISNNITLISSFQSCYLTRLYQVKLEFEFFNNNGKIGFKNGKKKIFVDVPIKVL